MKLGSTLAMLAVGYGVALFAWTGRDDATTDAGCKLIDRLNQIRLIECPANATSSDVRDAGRKFCRGHPGDNCWAMVWLGDAYAPAGFPVGQRAVDNMTATYHASEDAVQRCTVDACVPWN